jgi:hypothetical protein
LIDLVSDDEEGVVKKRKSSSPIDRREPKTSLAATVTVRKRQPALYNIQDDTPSRPPPKRQKSPTGLSVVIPAKITPIIQPPSNLTHLVPPPDSFTQIPDSEGEEDDDVFGGDDYDFASDDIPLSAKKLLSGTAGKEAQQRDESMEEDYNIVPESPIKAGKSTVEREVSQALQLAAKRMYPSLPAQSSSIEEIRNTLSASTKSSAQTDRVKSPTISSWVPPLESSDHRQRHRISTKRLSFFTRRELRSLIV